MVSGTQDLNNSFTNSLRGISGLTGGLDRDGMIEKMTMRTRSRIARYKQKLQIQEWKQQAYRGLADNIIDFEHKYLSASSSDSLLLNKTFSDYTIDTLGNNRDALSASGDTKGLDGLEILGATNKATDASFSTDTVSGAGSAIITSKIDLDKEVNFGSLEGKTLEFRVGQGNMSQDYSIQFKTGDYNIYKNDVKHLAEGEKPEVDPEKAKKVEALLNSALSDTDVLIGHNTYKLSDLAAFKIDEKTGAVTLGVNKDKKVSGGEALGSLNAMKLIGGSALSSGITGVNSIANFEKDGFNISNQEYSLISDGRSLLGGYKGDGKFDKITAGDVIRGKAIEISYNGKRTSIKIPTEKTSVSEGISYDLTNVKGIAQYINDQAKKAFGADISVSEQDGKLQFQSRGGTFTVSGSESSHLFGKEGLLGISNYTSNRISLDSKIDASTAGNPLVDKLNAWAKAQIGDEKADTFADLLSKKPEEGKTLKKLEFKINGNTIEIDRSKIKTIGDLVKEINNSDNITQRGETDGKYNSIFKVSYNSIADKFDFVSEDKGSSAVIDERGLFDGTDTNSLTQTLFGRNAVQTQKGNDAMLFVKGVDKPLVSSTNEFMVNGVKISINREFNVKNGSLIDPNQSGVTFKSNVKVDDLYKKITDMVKDYNTMVGNIDSQFSTLPERDGKGQPKYIPLSDEQKEKMSSKEIELWEEKAKKGLLFGDSELREVKNGISNMFVNSPDMYVALRDIGITINSNNYKGTATISVDENKLKDAISNHLDKVRNVFMGNDNMKGLANNMKETLSSYAKDTGVYKGSLVRLAGSKYAPLSMLSNQMQDKIKDMNTIISTYQDELKRETDRYIKQFAHLETIMARANNQSGYIAQMQGG